MIGVMATETGTRAPRLSAALREGERVMPLELFFDLVFVLALTQCTALMSHHPTWSGLGQGVLVLAVLWWSWTGYAWLSHVPPALRRTPRFTNAGASFDDSAAIRMSHPRARSIP